MRKQRVLKAEEDAPQDRRKQLIRGNGFLSKPRQELAERSAPACFSSSESLMDVSKRWCGTRSKLKTLEHQRALTFPLGVGEKSYALWWLLSCFVTSATNPSVLPAPSRTWARVPVVNFHKGSSSDLGVAYEVWAFTAYIRSANAETPASPPHHSGPKAFRGAGTGPEAAPKRPRQLHWEIPGNV